MTENYLYIIQDVIIMYNCKNLTCLLFSDYLGNYKSGHINFIVVGFINSLLIEIMRFNVSGLGIKFLSIFIHMTIVIM